MANSDIPINTVSQAQHLQNLDKTSDDRDSRTPFLPDHADATSVTEVSMAIPADIIESSCEAYLKLYADTAANFTKCAILFARPLRFCENCVYEYVRTKAVYDVIMEVSLYRTFEWCLWKNTEVK